jgi:hypothetical protein
MTRVGAEYEPALAKLREVDVADDELGNLSSSKATMSTPRSWRPNFGDTYEPRSNGNNETPRDRPPRKTNDFATERSRTGPAPSRGFQLER